MSCLAPRYVKDKQGSIHAVPCGQCVECLKKRRRDWSFRLVQEWRDAAMAHFITLTYDDEHMPDGASLSKRDLQLFMKRLRKRYSGLNIRYYVAGEYGPTTNRPHYHGIFYNLPDDMDEVYLSVLKAWQKGNISVFPANEKTINYVTKDVISRITAPEGVEPPFHLQSTRPGLGAGFLDRVQRRYSGAFTRHSLSVFLPGGVVAGLPRYYSNKLYTGAERRIIAKLAYGDQPTTFEDFVSRYPRDQWPQFVRQKEQQVKNKQSTKL